MSHGPPPPMANFFDFGIMGMGSEMPTPQMNADANDMMSLLDTPLYGFDSMSMNLDVNDAMPQTYAPSPAQLAPTAALAASTDQLFSPEDMVTNMPGAGPLPVAAMNSAGGSGPAASSSAPNMLTEFTKRRNWPARVIEDLQDVLQILDAEGKIKHVSASVEGLTGHSTAELLNHFVEDFMHPDDIGVFKAEFNDAIATGGPLRVFYRFRKKDGTYATFEVVGHAHIAAAKFAPNPDNQTPFCQAVFMMSRLYPTKNAGLLDSFLEHKMENERLKRRIAELKREEAEEVEESARTWRLSQEGRSDITPSESTVRANATPFHQGMTNAETTMSSSEELSSRNIALTRENLEAFRPDSIREKMFRYDGATHAETIEMLTGLRYQEGERSRGITTGNASPTLIKGDAGIAIPMDRDPRAGEKKKKIKMAEEYVCTDCGTLDSPEWRKGPGGPKSLCNACGLRYAKKLKREAAAAKNGTNGNEVQTPMENDN